MQSIVDDCVKAKLNSVAYDLLCAGEDRAADAVYAVLEHMTIAPSHREGEYPSLPAQGQQHCADLRISLTISQPDMILPA